MLDGKIVALDHDGRPAFQALQHRSLKPTAVVFYAFDLLHLGATDYRSKPLSELRRALPRLKFAAPILLSVPLPGTPEEIEEVIRKQNSNVVVAEQRRPLAAT